MGRIGFRKTGFAGKGAGRSLFVLLVVLITALSVLLFLYNAFWSGERYRVRETVETFYTYEQAGDYGSAWELLHSQMKAHFDKETYTRIRSGVYTQWLGAGRIAFTLGKPESLSVWSMTDSAQTLADVYRVPVEQRFLSVFGTLAVNQDVFAAREDGEWRILWSYRLPAGLK